MKIYKKDNLEEWSRKLRSRYGNQFRLYSSEEETMERWAFYLSSLYNIKPFISDSIEDTLKEWSKLIGG